MSKVTVENGFRLSVHRLMCKGRFGHDDTCLPATYRGTWQWTNDGKPCAHLAYTIHQTATDSARLELSNQAWPEGTGHLIRLIAKPCRFGGTRWFARCPRTGRMVSKLYRPNGAQLFLARQAYRLAYLSQCDAPGLDRAYNQRQRLMKQKLKCEFHECPVKPKWMRLKTYDVICQKLERLNYIVDTNFLWRFKCSLQST